MTVPVSVIIPFHNDVAHLPECLASIRAQTVRPAEIVLADDGSDVASKRFLESLPGDIQVISLGENRGPGVARNAAVEASTQPYVAFMDSDDRWLPSKLKAQYELMSAWPELDVTHTGAQVFDDESGHKALFTPGAQQRISVEAALTNYRLVTPSIMMKRQSFDRIGGFDPQFRCTQDWDMHVRMVLAGFRFEFLPECLVEVRRNHDHHCGDWRCFLAGHTRVVMKHRGTYISRLGVRGWLHQLAFELWRGGQRQGKLLGELLKIPHKIGI